MNAAATSGWIGLVLSILTLASILGVVVAYLRVSLAQATIATLKESNEALRARNAELDTVVIKMEARMLIFENDNRVLREAVVGKESNLQVIATIENHHRDVMIDRTMFAERYTEAQLALGERLDANHKALKDILVLLGHSRANEVIQ